MGEPIVLDRLRQQCVGQFSSKTFAERTESKLLLAFDSVALAVSLLGNVCVDRFRKNIDLFSNKCQQGCCGPLANAHGATGISQVAAHEGVAEAVVIAAATFDRCQVGFRQSVMTHQLALFRRGIKQSGNLRFVQSLMSCQLMPPGP